MEYSNIIEIDIWSSFGCFSKSFSTTGGILTYLIPPKTSIMGMIGAILGIEFDEYDELEDGIKKYKIEKLNDIKISVQPLFDLKTKRVTYNRIEGNLDKIEVSNLHQDILIKPYYKLFISFPIALKEFEELFLKRIKNNQTIYNLYMGRNEFPLNINFIRQFKYESKLITNDDIFNGKIFGSLNRKSIKNTSLRIENNEKTDNAVLTLFSKSNEGSYLKSFYEYVVKDYPVKRWNFSNFIYSPISFYSSKIWKDCWFSDIEIKEDCQLELCKIGENEWISLI